MDIEEWRAIPGFEGSYEVSNMGQIRSLDRVVPHKSCGTLHMKGRVLRPSISRGYKHVQLLKDAKSRTMPIHKAVALAFIGPRPAGYDICHNDGDRLNNTAENLRYGTRTENVQDMFIHDTNSRINQTHCVNGHEFNEENTIWTKQGTRVCLACKRRRSREWAKNRKPHGKGTRLRETCTHGHEMTEENTEYTATGRRRCLACVAEKKKSRAGVAA